MTKPRAGWIDRDGRPIGHETEALQATGGDTFWPVPLREVKT